MQYTVKNRPEANVKPQHALKAKKKHAKWSRADVNATSGRRIDVNTTSLRRHVLNGLWTDRPANVVSAPTLDDFKLLFGADILRRW